MPEMRRRQYKNDACYNDFYNNKSERVWVYQGLFRLAPFFFTRYSMRPLRYGKREIKNNSSYENGACMSRLWERVLNIFNFIGDSSGCHQIPERCFCINGYTFPLCARCTGVLSGQFLAVILLLFKIRVDLFPGVLMLLTMGLDWMIQYYKWIQSTNTRRFITGIMGGLGLFSIYIEIAIRLFHFILQR